MPIISAFFGIVVRMYYDDHAPPHLHAEYQGHKAMLDLHGDVLRGDLRSKTALRLVREWIELHNGELNDDWQLAREGRDIRPIPPLD